MTQDLSENDRPVVSKIVERLSKQDLFFKSQQRGDPEISYLEKENILSDLIENKPFLFLTRYGEYLLIEEFSMFNSENGDETINYLVDRLKKTCDAKTKATQVRNRRFEALNRLSDEGKYFSMEEMKFREPLLFQQMVGKYMTPEELEAKIDRSDLRFSTILYKHMDVMEENHRYKFQKDKENSQKEECDSDDEFDEYNSIDNSDGSPDEMEEEEDEDEDDNDKDNGDDFKKYPSRKNGSVPVPISLEEKRFLKEEFEKIVKDKFMNGQDVLFDYSEVDNNAEYDCIQMREMDEQEKYFDDEEPENIESDSCSSLSDFSEEKDEQQKNICD